MITYELAKQLKDAGFPKKIEEYTICDKCNYPCPPISNHGYPTLSELIEECRKSKDNIDFCLRDFSTGDNSEWICGNYMPYEHDWIEYSTGSTPEEAVAKLWLELNKK